MAGGTASSSLLLVVGVAPRVGTDAPPGEGPLRAPWDRRLTGAGASRGLFQATEELPANVKVSKAKNSNDFRGAGGDGIKNHGKAEIEIETQDGKIINNVVQVAEVTRALHSTGVICDTKKEVLFTDEEAVVVPKGTLSKFLGAIQRIATYKRKGGLYVAKMKVRQRASARRKDEDGKASPFGRPGGER